MLIGVTADTHSRKIPKQLIKDFNKADIVVHAGDFCSREDFEVFRSFKKLIAVFGNMDEPALVKKLPEKTIFKADTKVIGLYHGEGRSNSVLQYVKEHFKKEKVDMVIYGHSHLAFNEIIDGVLYFNPGSPNDDVSAPFCSYGLVNIENNQINAKIIKVKG